MKKFTTLYRLLVCALFTAGIQCSVVHAVVYKLSVSDGTSGTTVAEGTTSQVVSVTISPAVLAGDEVQVSYETIDSTAIAANNDYTGISGGILTFNSTSASTQEVDLTTIADGIVENDEKLVIRVFNPIVTSGISTVSWSGDVDTGITITSSDVATVTLNGVTTSAVEGANLEYQVDLSQKASEDVVVTYTIAGSGSDVAEVSDYSSSGSVTITAGTQSVSLLVAVFDDAIVENSEELTVTLSGLSSGVTAVSLGTSLSATGTLIDNDSAVVDLVSVTPSAVEGANLEYQVDLSQKASEDVVVTYTIAGSGSDVAEVSDYSSSGSVTITAGTQSVSLLVAVVDDAIVENSEELTVTLSGLSSGVTAVSLGTSLSATGTLIDNDSAVVDLVSVTPSAVEGANLEYQVDLSQKASEDVVVTYTIAGSGSDVAEASDYNSSGSVTITAGTQSVSLLVAVVDDAIVENSEELTISLSGVSSGVTAVNLGTSLSATGTLIDNDSAVVDLVSVTPSAVEGANLEYQVDLSQKASEDVVVTYTIAGSGSDVAEVSDYSSSGSVTITAGTQSVSLLVAVVDDAIIENSEELTVTLSGVSSGVTAVNLGTSLSATGTLIDNDAAVVDLVSVTPSAVEGANLEYQVDLSQKASEDVTVNYSVVGSGSDVAEASDYTSTGTVTIAAGTQSASILIAVVDDLIVENSEELTVTLSGVSSSVSAVSLGTSLSATGTLVDNDSAVVDLSGVTTSAVEGANLAYQVDLSQQASEDVTVNYSIVGSGSDVAEVTDYTSTGTVTIAAGSQSASILIAVVDDLIVENSEELTVTLSGVSSSVSAVSLGTSLSATGTLVDNDSAVVDLSGVTTSAVEGANLAYQVDLSQQASEDVVVTYTIAGSGSDVAEVSDYSSSGSVTITAGTQSVSLLVAVVDDAIVENSEELTVTLSGVSSGVTAVSLGTGLSATGTLIDNDSAVVDLVSVTPSAVEGANLEYQVDLSQKASEDVTVNYSVVGSGSDVAEASDYTSTGTVTIAAGTQSASILIAVVDDLIVENSEELTVTLSGVSSSVSGVSLGTSLSATGTLIDNDSTVVDLSGVTTSAVEGANLAYQVDLSQQASEDVTVNYSIVGSGSDVAEASDYTSTGTVTIAAGTQSASILIAVVDDLIVENSEELTVTLSGVSSSVSAVSLGTSLSATGTLIDNDSAVVDLSGVTTSAVEGTNLEYQVDLSQQASEDVTVSYTIVGSGSDVAEVTDYTSAGSVTIAAGTQSASILIAVVDDLIVENSEELTITLDSVSSSVSAVSLGTSLSATGTLVDNDSAVVDLSGVTTSTVEGTNLEYQVDLSQKASEDVTVSYTIVGSGSDVAEVTDYTSAGSVTIAAGTQSASILIAVVDDLIVENSEELTITLDSVSSSVSAVSLGTSLSATGTLVDNDSAVVDLSGVTTSAVEGTNLEYQVDLSQKASEDVVVTYTIAGSGSDVAEVSDYSSSGSVTITAGTQSVSLLVAVVDDAIVENSEELTLSLSGVSSGVTAVSLGASLAATGTLIDNDTAVVDLVSVTPSAVEGANLEYRVDLSQKASEDVVVTFTIAGSGSDIAEASDFSNSNSGSVTIAAGTQSVSLLVAVVDDAIVENSEELTVTLSGLSSGVTAVSLGTSLSATGTLIDNDSAVVDLVSVTPSAVEGANLEYQVDLSQKASEDVVVTYTIAGSGSDVAEASDYSSSGSVTITAGTQSVSLPVAVVDDAIVENSEELTVTLSGVTSSVSAIGLGTSLSATGTLVDNDTAEVALFIVNGSEVEGSGADLEYQIDLSHQTSEDITVTYTIAGYGADGAEPADYISSGSVTITAGDMSAPLMISVVDDLIAENTEGLVVTLSGVTSVLPVSLGTSISAYGSIWDNDSSEVTLTGVSTSDNEGNLLEYKVVLSKEVSEDVVVNFLTSPSGTDGAEVTDYLSVANVTLPAGTMEKTFTIGLVDDAICENTEEFTLSISLVSSGVSSVTTGSIHAATGTILDNDPSEVMLIGVTTSGTEGTSLEYKVALTNKVAEDVVVNFSTSPSGADGAEVIDYLSVATVTLPAGTMETTFTIGLVDDAIAENTEEFTLSVSLVSSAVSSVTAGASATALGTILDNDIAELSIDDVSVYEDAGVATFTVTSSRVVSPTAHVYFDINTADGTAVAGDDYAAIAAATGDITNGTTTTVAVSILADNDTVEPDETYTVELSNLSGVAANFVKDIGAGTILNDDFLVTLTWDPTFGDLVETTALGVLSSTGDVQALVYPMNSSPAFLATATVPCPNGLTHHTQDHHVSAFLVDGVSQAAAVLQPSFPHTLNNITSNHTIEAHFTSYIDFTVHTNGYVNTTSGSIATGSTGSIEVQAGDTLTVTAVPDSGFHISQVLVDGVSVGHPEVYAFENWENADATYEISFTINTFTLKPVSNYDTIFEDAAETILATETNADWHTDKSFFVNMDDPSHAVYGILVDNISYPFPASGVTVNYTGFSLTNHGGDNIEVKFINVEASHRLEVQDYDTNPIADTPLDATLRPKPASIMFVLDDSGSMDWEITTSGSNGLFNSKYYVYSYPGTDRARVYGDNSLEAANDHDEWRSQFFGVNKMFYNPVVTYVPWPTFTGTPTSQLPAVATDGLAHANMYRPRLHPWHSQDCTDAIDLANGVTTANINNCDNSTQDLHTFPMDGVFLEFVDNSSAIIVDNTSSGFSSSGDWDTATNSEMYGSDYLYTLKGSTVDLATWSFSPANTDKHTVYARWVDTSQRENITYKISSASLTSDAYVTVDQSKHGGEWVSLGEYSFTAGVTVTVSFQDNYGSRSSSCADAVKIVPGGDALTIINAHYFTWDDADGDGEVKYTDSDADGQLDQSETISEDIYLVNLTNPIQYYKVLNNAQPISGSNLQKVAAASLPSTVKTYASPTAADAWELERQNWADWFSYYRKRTLAATGAVARVIDQMEDVEVGIRTINYSSYYGISQGVLPVNVSGEVDQTNVLLEKLYAFQVDSYGTPLRRGLQAVGRYYDDTDTYTGGIGTSPYNAKEDGDECKQVFAILMTDGYWNGGDPGVGNVDGNNGTPYADGYSNTLADVAMYYFENDLSSMDDLVPDGIHNHQHMVTYTVSFGVYGSLNPSNFDLINGPYPSWPSPWGADSYKIDDMWHAAVNGRGKYMSASRPDELVDSLLDIMNDIGTRVGSGASVSVNGDEMYESINSTVRMYQTTYNSGDWHGDLKSYKVDTTTGDVLTNTPVWSAEEQLATKLTTSGAGHVNRIIATYTGGSGVPFRWDNLTTLQQTQLFPHFIASTSTSLTGEDVVNYLRGYKAYETSASTGEFRERDASHPIGDVIHSLARFEDDVLYMGSNDGMLHAFWATDAGLGKELFAYVPNLVFPKLRELADPAYDHYFYVDNTPDTQEMGTKTYLVSGVGKGGKGYYCLDITGVLTSGTTRTSTVVTEADLASRVKWEFPRQALATGSTYTFTSGTTADRITDSANGFSSSLYSVGQKISVSGAGSNDGVYTVTAVDGSGGYIEISAGSLTTGVGNNNTVTLNEVLLSGNTFTFLSNSGIGEIHDSNNGFSSSIFSVGQVISVAGANYADGSIGGTNDGQYKITYVDSTGSYIKVSTSLITGYGDGKNITMTQAISDPNMGYSFSKAYFVKTNDTSIGSGDLQGWVVIFGNGYASESGTASLYIVNPETGALIKRIDTNVGPFNGLSSPNAIDVDNDIKVDYVYAGDLLGNMWKFDLSSTQAADWQVAYCDSGSATDHCKDTVSGMIPKPLFAGLSNQPITGAPDIKRSQTGEGYMVIFGTGKYMGDTDLNSTDIQSLYGIWDWAPDALDSGYNGARVDVGTTTPKAATLSNWPEKDTNGDSTHTLLVQVAWVEGVTTEDTNGNGVLDSGEDTDSDGVLDEYSYYRTISNYAGDWTMVATNDSTCPSSYKGKDINGDGSINDEDLVPVSNVGWVFDLPGKIDLTGDGVDNDKDGVTDETGERIPGERMVNDTLIRDGRAIMISFGVTGTRCNAGAYSFLNERDADTGGMTAYAVYDLNGDGEIDADDGVVIQAPYDVNGDGKVDADDVIMAYPSDIAYEGRLYNPAILRESDDSDKDPEETKYMSSSSGGIQTVKEKAERRGFSYWQQME